MNYAQTVKQNSKWFLKEVLFNGLFKRKIETASKSKHKIRKN